MLGDTGTLLILLAWIVQLYAAIAAFTHQRSGDRRWGESARRAFYAGAALLGVALLTLTLAFLSNAFEIRYVAQHSSRVLPIYLKLTAIWAGQEGSLLLWSAMQALFAALAVRYPPRKTETLIPWTVVFLGLIGAFFTGLTLFLSNPFAQLLRAPLDGQGLNPLLRHPGMIFHPPTMYIGYVGLAVPFAFALAALIVEPEMDWPAPLRTWLLVAWLGLSLGLLLGMRWAYDVLGWGGYWAWDPVENAGLMPWFTATALLHGAVMQNERRGFRAWNYLLAIFSFALVLFGTFATRSGVIQSVHAYARSNLGGVFLAAILITLAGSLGLVLHRRARLKSEEHLEALLSRDGLFFITLVLFATLTLSVFVGSVLPTLTQLLSGRAFEAGPAWFDRVTGPQFGALVLLLGLCPLAGRSAAAIRRLRQRGWLIGAGAALAVIIAALTGFRQAVSLAGFACVGLASSTILVEYAEAVRQHTRQKGSAPLNALWALMRAQRRRYGGYLVHLGVVLMAVGVIGTRMYPFERQVTLRPNTPQQVGDYTLVLENLSRDLAADHVSTWATVSISEGGRYRTTLEPRINQYTNFDQRFSIPALHPTLRDDVYLILAGWDGNGATVTVRLMVNPLANFLWAGGLVFIAGGALALWPHMRRAAWNRIAALLIAGLLLGSAWAMWGASHGTVNPGSGRPQPGAQAPAWRLSLQDGSLLTQNDARGKVTVLNFWAPWCSTCKDNLPFLQATWEAYQEQPVLFVGAAYRSNPSDVAAETAALGLSYPIGLDANDRMARAYGITGVPETFILDPEGRVVYVHIGPISAAQLTAELDALLAGGMP